MNGKVAFLTGGGGYIGNAIAIKLASLGAKIAVCDINIETAQITANQIKQSGGTAMAIAADVTNSQSIDKAIETAFDTFSGLDVMIHIAGGSARSEMRHLIQQTDEVIAEVLNTNLLGALYSSRAAARIMVRQNNGGRIVNFSSVVAFNGLKGCVDYAAAKGGVVSMTKSLAKELGEYKITVNSIAPGIVMRPTENLDNQRAVNTNFLKSKCTAEDIASLAAFIVSDEANFITGQTYVIDGGRGLAMKGTD